MEHNIKDNSKHTKKKISDVDIRSKYKYLISRLSHIGIFEYIQYKLTLQKTLSISLLIASFICTIIATSKFTESFRASASIIKKSTIATSENALKSITHNGEEMYVANATFYDYYSDSQIGSSNTPNEITDALASNKNTFSKLNNKLLQLMKYSNPNECPAKYPLYQGRPGALSDMDGICSPLNETNFKSVNYWAGANWGQVAGVATQGLVDSSLMIDSSGNTFLTQSNPINNKSAKVPFFDKDFLTKNKHDNSSLSLGSVYENISFPFRRVEKNGIIYYQFYSNKDTIRIKNNGELAYLGYGNTSEQVKDAEGGYGFFPYNNNSESTSNKLNFGHGVRIDIPFNMTKDGKIKNQDMIFDFSGDDDVWVFIDGELALDIGGNHGEVSGSINFATSVSTVNKVKNNNVAFAKRTLSSFNAGNNTFTDLGINSVQGVYTDHQTKFSNKLKNSLKDTKKTHTLTLFYMERGLNVANMKISFNLPEPTQLNITNTIDISNVGETFKTETNNVASKDAFMYDVSDRDISRSEEIDLCNKEAVSFTNEFEKKHNILTQQKSLKISTRSLTKLYSTTWILSDTSVQISKGNNLLVTDDRSTKEKTFLFANKNNDDVPVLTADYINTPNIGTLELSCNITDAYKSKNTSYKNSKFIYTIKYSNVFGGNSSWTPYKGNYIIQYNDGTKKTYSTKDGNVTLSPEQKLIINNIPVETLFNVTGATNTSSKLAQIKATENFKSKIKDMSAQGKINSTSNIIKFTFSKKTNDSNSNNKDSKNNKEETITIPINKTPSNSNPTSELEDINELDLLDSSPSTSDESIVNVWLIFGIVSLMTGIGSFLYLRKFETARLKL